MPSLYDQSVPLFVKYFNLMDAILTKAEQWCEEKNVDGEELLAFRLIADQRPSSYQVITCTDIVKWFLQRAEIIEPRVWEDNEKTFPELHARIQKALDLLKEVHRDQLDGKEKEPIKMTSRMGNFNWESTEVYLAEYAIPNFHFHFSTCELTQQLRDDGWKKHDYKADCFVVVYNILRHKGVPLDAWDYLGKDTFTSRKVEQA